jgi:hypothetical protein
MKRAILVALGTGAIISSAAALGIGSASSRANSVSMTRAEYLAALEAIELSRGETLAACDVVTGFDREICRAEVAAEEMVLVAEIEQSFRRDQPAAREAQRSRIEARYQVARTKCQAIGGARRDQCLIDTHAVRGRALLEAQAPYEIRN